MTGVYVFFFSPTYLFGKCHSPFQLPPFGIRLLLEPSGGIIEMQLGRSQLVSAADDRVLRDMPSPACVAVQTAGAR